MTEITAPPMNLHPDQSEALDLVLQKKISIVTGGAGTGKSTVVDAIVREHARSGFQISLAAPSGKAAKRLSEITGKEATTIHRLLEPAMVGGRFVFARNSDRQLDTNLLIVDESSMVDISLMANLMEAVSPTAKIVLVGDHYQLPPVGPGSPFRDLLVSGMVPAKELSVIKRQKDGMIIQNAHRIKNGQDILFNNNDGQDFFFIQRNDEEAILTKIIDFFSSSFLAQRKVNPLRDVQVIAPLREKTLLSCKNINAQLQKSLNPRGETAACRFKIGDKVIQARNDYNFGIVNGDMGFVTQIDSDEKLIEVKFENPDRVVNLPLRGNDLELAYAITVHKSQGSEWPIVIMPVHRSFGGRLCQRNLLYTAVTRAKELLILIGQREEIPKIVRRNDQGRRFSNLAKLLNGEQI